MSPSTQIVIALRPNDPLHFDQVGSIGINIDGHILCGHFKTLLVGDQGSVQPHSAELFKIGVVDCDQLPVVICSFYNLMMLVRKQFRRQSRPHPIQQHEKQVQADTSTNQPAEHTKPSKRITDPTIEALHDLDLLADGEGLACPSVGRVCSLLYAMLIRKGYDHRHDLVAFPTVFTGGRDGSRPADADDGGGIPRLDEGVEEADGAEDEND